MVFIKKAILKNFLGLRTRVKNFLVSVKQPKYLILSSVSKTESSSSVLH